MTHLSPIVLAILVACTIAPYYFLGCVAGILDVDTLGSSSVNLLMPALLLSRLVFISPVDSKS
jgi:hypothetical protein